MSNTITIVEAEEIDLPQLENLLAELLVTLENSTGIELSKALENCHILLNDSDSCLLVAKMDGSVVRFINFTIRKTMLHKGPSALIDEIVVSKQYRGQRIGKRLVSAAIERCRVSGCCEVEVSTEKVNDKAREFYKKCGFREDAVLLEMHL